MTFCNFDTFDILIFWPFVILTFYIVMVDGPAVGKAGDCLDRIAGGLERMNSKILVTSVRFGQRPRIFDKFSFVLK